MSKVSLIITIYKNESNIVPFYEDFQKNIAPSILDEGDDYEIIMVNDDSPDDSWEIMSELAQRDNHVRLLRLSRNFGAVAAVFAGLEYATGDCITVKACDLQEPSELTVRMYREWKNGEKMIFAVREDRNDGFMNDFFSNAYYFIMRKMVVHSMPKGGFDIYMIDKRVRDKIVKMNDKNSNIALQLMWLGFHPKHVYYVRKKREIGKSSWTFAKKLKLFIDSIVGFSYVPIRFMTGIGVTFLFLSIIFVLKVLWDRLNNLIPVQGWASLVIITMFSAGMIMFTLGILGEYIWRTMEASRNRPLSVVRDSVGFEDGDVEAEKNEK